jgi:tetratricopeptide (TPR) repeat protein
MPYLQEPEVGNALRYARSDHTIPIPRPTFDARLGADVACQLCHTDRSVATLQAAVGRWWGELKPQPRAVVALSAMGERGITGADSRIAGPRELLDIATDTADRHDMARFVALGELLLRESGPDAAGLDGEAVGKLSALAGDRDDDIAAAALAVLHQTRGEESAIRRLLVDLIGRLDRRERAVRARWAVLLGFIGDRRRAANDPRAAVLAYRRALEVRPDHAPTLLNLGLAYAQQGDYSSAEQAYAESIRLDASNTLAYVNLGIARAARGDEQGAAATYREAIAVDPADPLPHFNLGNVFLRAGDARQAIEHYERAALLDPSLAPAHFNLARAHLALQNMSRARDALRRGLEFDPRNNDARQLLNQLDAGLTAPR